MTAIESGKPVVSVAAIVEQAGRFLLVEEWVRGKQRLNLPAGHLDAGESILQAVVRETLEETGYAVIPDYLIGVYQWRSTKKSHVRFALSARVESHHPDHPLDQGIIQPVWLHLPEIKAAKLPLRSASVMRSICDYLDGRRLPLEGLNVIPPL